MTYWFHSTFRTDERRLEPLPKEKLTFFMIDKTSSGNSYPNINKIKEGDKIIFLQNLIAFGNGKINLIERSKKTKVFMEEEKISYLYNIRNKAI